MFEQFHDGERGGFYQTGADHEQLVVRRKDFIDNAIPSGNSMAAEALLRLAALLGNDDYRKEAAQIVLTMKDLHGAPADGLRAPADAALDALLAPSQEIAIVGDPEQPETQALLRTVRRRYLPHAVLALKRPDEESMLPVLEGRTLVEGKPAAYVCENYACRLPGDGARKNSTSCWRKLVIRLTMQCPCGGFETSARALHLAGISTIMTA